jgi:hypothetical protein
MNKNDIYTDPGRAYRYARDVIKGRFEEGEDAISMDHVYAYWYAKYVVKGRFEKGEDAISKHPEYADWYAREVLREIKLTKREKFVLMFQFPDLIKE